MRRGIVAILICVLVGFIATIGIAWGVTFLPARTGVTHFAMTGVPGVPTRWIKEVPDDWPDGPFGIAIISRSGQFSATTMSLRVGPVVRLRQGMNTGLGGGSMFMNDDPRYVVDIHRAGWPWKTMERRGADDARPRAGTAVGRLFESGIPRGNGEALALAPMWPGFLLSVLMWSTACIALGICAWTPRAWKRRRRQRDGRCIRCGYQLGDMATCPECGSIR